MRPIKFRAWDKKANRMVFGCCNLVLSLDGYLQFEYGGHIKDINVNDNYELMQFTGLKDKNGKEIYEGDIIRYMDGKNMEVFYSTKGCYVGWHLRRKPNHGRMGMVIYGLYDHSKYPNAHEEVIGNVHENPELLEEKK